MIFGSSGQGEAGTGKSEARGLMPWSEEAKEKVRELGEQGEVGQCVALVRTSLTHHLHRPECFRSPRIYFSCLQEINIATETVVLSPTQPSSLSIPSAAPCYFFYKHSAGLGKFSVARLRRSVAGSSELTRPRATVLIYSCPPSSPVKSRLIYSSAVLILYKVAVPQYTGQQVIKKVSPDFALSHSGRACGEAGSLP
jgi:twinfilin-like protein